MANRVVQSPYIPSPQSQNVDDIPQYLTYMVQALVDILRDDALRLNTAMMADGSEIPSAPVMMHEYLKTALPSAVLFKGGMIMVTNETGGYVAAFSDGTNWRRVTDRAVVA